MNFKPTNPNIRRIVTIDYASLSTTDEHGIEHFNQSTIDMLIDNFNSEEYLVQTVSLDGRAKNAFTTQHMGEIIAACIIGDQAARELRPDALRLLAVSLKMNLGLRLVGHPTNEAIFERLLPTLLIILPQVVHMPANVVFKATVRGLKSINLITELKAHTPDTEQSLLPINPTHPDYYAAGVMDATFLHYQVELMARTLAHQARLNFLPSLLIQNQTTQQLCLGLIFHTSNLLAFLPETAISNYANLEDFKAQPVAAPLIATQNSNLFDSQYGFRVSAAIDLYLSNNLQTASNNQVILAHIKKHFENPNFTQQHLDLILLMYHGLTSFTPGSEAEYEAVRQQLLNVNPFHQAAFEQDLDVFVQELDNVPASASAAAIAEPVLHGRVFGPMLPIDRRVESIIEVCRDALLKDRRGSPIRSMPLYIPGFIAHSTLENQVIPQDPQAIVTSEDNIIGSPTGLGFPKR